jgi:alkanesulfonate monooxygenase
MALQIEHIACGRFAINLVNAWNMPELEKAGIPFAPHDERYAYGHEWISIVEPLMRGETTTFRGKYFNINGYTLRPADPYRARPKIYVGGESEPARGLVADRGDVWFINGQPLEDVRALIADVAARPRKGKPLEFGLSAFIIARETEAEAEAALHRLSELARLDAPIRAVQRANTDPYSVMAQTMSKTPRIGSNGGTAAGLVGSYDQVASRIRAFGDVGVELFMLQFQPFEAEMRRFAAEVMPRVRRL